MNARPIITDFSAGEVTPLLAGRIDLAVYTHSAETIENFMPLSTGGATKRTGSVYIGRPAVDGVCRLVPFVVDETSSYILEFTNLLLRIWYQDALVTSGGPPLTFVTPYTATQVNELQFAQGYDGTYASLYITHSSHAPRVFRSLTTTTFSLGAIGFTGSCWTPSTAYTKGYILVNSNRRYVCITGGISASSGGPTTTAADIIDGACHWKYAEDYANQSEILVPFQSAGNYPACVALMNGRLWFGRTQNEPQTTWASKPFEHNNFSFLEMQETLSQELFSATIQPWEANAIVPLNGVCTNNQKRYTATTAGTTGKSGGPTGTAATFTDGTVVWRYDGPQWVDRYTYRDFISDGCAIKLELASDENDVIQWMTAHIDMIVGTTTSEYIIPGNVTGSAIRAQVLTRYGSARMQGKIIGDAIVFVQGGKERIREYKYSNGAQQSPDLTYSASHILKGGVVSFDFAQSPEPQIYFVRADGILSVLNYHNSMGILAWCRYIAGGGGLYKSVCIIPGANRDTVYAIVERGGAYSLEKFIDMLPDSQVDDCFLDGGVARATITGGNVTVPTIMNGKTVAVVVDGVRVPDKVVAAGQVTGLTGSKAHIGFPYTGTIKTMRILDTQAPFRMRNIFKAWVRFHRTADMKIGYTNATGMLEPFHSDIWYSGNKPLSFRGDTTTDGYVMIISDEPLPCTILVVCPEMEVN